MARRYAWLRGSWCRWPSVPELRGPSLRYTDHIVRVLHRLPLCTAAELAALCRPAPVTLREDLRRLIKAAWVERINLTDPDWEQASDREQV